MRALCLPGDGAGVECGFVERSLGPVVGGTALRVFGDAGAEARSVIRALFSGLGRGLCRELAGGWAGVLCPVFPVNTGVLAFFRDPAGGSGMFTFDFFMRSASHALERSEARHEVKL